MFLFEIQLFCASPASPSAIFLQEGVGRVSKRSGSCWKSSFSRNRLPKIRKKINFLLESFSKNRIKYLEILRQRGFDVVEFLLLLFFHYRIAQSKVVQTYIKSTGKPNFQLLLFSTIENSLRVFCFLTKVDVHQEREERKKRRGERCSARRA